MATKLAKIIADFTTQLATELSAAGTTATLASATDDDGVALPAGRYFFTIDGANSSKEHISCDLSGTALTNIKTTTRQGVETAGAARKHRIGASVTITDFAHIKVMNDLLDGTTDLNASVPLEYDGTATINSANQLATKAYVDGVAIAGGADASTSVKGITRVSVAPVSAAIPIAVGDNDGRVPTQSENDALVGTAGTPSTSNKYVTYDDTAVTAAASKVVRADANNKIDPNYVKVTDIQTFSASATANWTKPTGAKWVEVTAIGAGGGGAAASSGNKTGGGGGGSYAFKRFNASVLGSTESYTVGLGGAGGTQAGTNDGTEGTASSFGTTVLLRAPGGGGGTAAVGAGGVIGNGDITHAGGAGGVNGGVGTSTDNVPAPRGGGGGGFNGVSPPTATAGGAGGGFTTNYVKAGGAGGASGVNNGTAASATSTALIYGGVGGGGGGYNGNGTNTGGNGGAGNLGGGGGGANGTGTSGGAGGDGMIVVVTYF